MSSIGWSAAYDNDGPYSLADYERRYDVEGVFATYDSVYFGPINSGDVVSGVTYTWTPVIPGEPFGSELVALYTAHPSGTLVIDADVNGVPSTHKLLFVITLNYSYYNTTSYSFVLSDRSVSAFWTEKIGTVET